MKKLIRGLSKPSNMLPLVAIATMGFLVATELVSNATLTIITAAIALAVSFLIFVAYVPTAIYVFRRDARDREQNLFMGVLLLFGAIDAWHLWRVFWVLWGRPDWMVGHWFPSLLALVASMTGFYFLNVPGISRIGIRYTTLAVAIAFILSGIGLVIFESL